MTLTEHLTQANFDPRSRNNASLTLQMHYLVHSEKTPPRKFNVNCPFTKTSQQDFGVSSHSTWKKLFRMLVPNHPAQSKSDLRTQKKETNTLELYSSLLLNETPPRRLVISCHLWPYIRLGVYRVLEAFSTKKLISNDTDRAPYTG